MHERVLAKRYAAALFHAAQGLHIVDRVESDLRQIDAVAEASPLFVRVLKHPLLPEGDKYRVIDRALGDRVVPLSVSFLKHLVAKRRAALIPLLYEAFESFAEELRNEARLTVTSAVPLTDAERVQLVDALSWRTGKGMKPEFRVDPALIGGVMARVGDTVYDGSIASELRDLTQKLTFGHV
jgi:F-type H+-transporting ATPase subunit delta